MTLYRNYFKEVHTLNYVQQSVVREGYGITIRKHGGKRRGCFFTMSRTPRTLSTSANFSLPLNITSEAKSLLKIERYIYNIYRMRLRGEGKE